MTKAGSMRPAIEYRIWRAAFVLGAIAVLAMAIPYAILGEDAIFVYHDQLDGEVIAYLLQARHLFGGGTLPEFLGGADKTALTPPAPAAVLLYRWLPGHVALAMMQVLSSFVGYLGMFLLLREMMKAATADGVPAARGSRVETLYALAAAFIPCVVGVLYAYLPFLPVYGLSQYGLPMLLWCFLRLGKERGAGRIFYYVYGIFYALNSSLVLCGYAVLGGMLLAILWNCFGAHRAESGRASARRQLLLWGLLLITYLVENATLLWQMFFGATTSHKAEVLLQGTDFLKSLLTNLTEGGQHSEGLQASFLIGILLVWVLQVIRRWCGGIRDNDMRGKWLTTALTMNLLLALFAALWDSSACVALRSHLGALGAFQANRVLWLMPCLWYLALGLSLQQVLAWIQEARRGARLHRTGSYVLAALLIAMTALTSVRVLLASNAKPNIQRLRNADYAALSFHDYYATDLMPLVEEIINERTGEERSAYRVASLGIDPAAALYYGFYCLDGYSNNYSLAYKHAFREIIAPELDKSDYIRESYDNWGNRVYLYSAESPGYYTIGKGGFVFLDYDIDTEAFTALGGRYLLSAAYILNPEETGLALLVPEPIQTQDSYYQLYLYEVVD